MAERAAIVTGGSRGIGLALAEVLADEGYGLTVTARKPETLEQAANTLRQQGPLAPCVRRTLSKTSDPVVDPVRVERVPAGRPKPAICRDF